MENYLAIVEKIKEAKNILLVSHIGPDGDTIGSTLALATLIKDNFEGKNVDFVIQHKIPDIYKFLPGVYDAFLTNREITISCYDLAIAVDCATKARMGYIEKIYDKAKFKINIDHHITNPKYANINVINSAVSSCGELIFDFALQANFSISKDVATCLYTAILADTGAFRYSNTTAETLKAASMLVELGANPHTIYEYCFERRPVEMLKIASRAMADAIFLANDKIAYTVVDRTMLSNFNALDEHLEGIPEMLRQATSVEVAFVLKETVKNEAKFSFRSKTLDVSSLCSKFGGGGHKCAAGCILKGPLNDALAVVLPEVEKLVRNDR